MIRQTVRVAWPTTRRYQIELLTECFRVWDDEVGAADVYYTMSGSATGTVPLGASKAAVNKRLRKALEELVHQAQDEVGPAEDLAIDRWNRVDAFKLWVDRWRRRGAEELPF